MSNFVDQLAREVSRETARRIEERVLRGENDFVQTDPVTGTQIRYTIPAWWKCPRTRLRVARARRAYRRRLCA